MGIRNLLVWNPNPHPNLVGYDVVINAGGTTTVPSNVFLDPAVYADEDTADAILYSVSANVNLSKGLSLSDDEIPDSPTLRIQRWTLDDSKYPLCLVSGQLLNLIGTVLVRPEIRVWGYWEDTPVLAPAGGYMLGGDVSIYGNYRGEFQIPLVQEVQVMLHIPEAHLHGRFVVPAETTADLKDIGFEPVELYRNN